MQRRGKRGIPEKTRLPAASSSTIPTCENPGATQPGTEYINLFTVAPKPHHRQAVCVYRRRRQRSCDRSLPPRDNFFVLITRGQDIVRRAVGARDSCWANTLGDKDRMCLKLCQHEKSFEVAEFKEWKRKWIEHILKDEGLRRYLAMTALVWITRGSRKRPTLREERRTVVAGSVSERERLTSMGGHIKDVGGRGEDELFSSGRQRQKLAVGRDKPPPPPPPTRILFTRRRE
ncbi:hypothetical protein PR048_028885 [Dryococelus australis]|uniref:Uncharacterized protein n=1 Tax=Dryococelus australis TaxID=614101 RepID=A0ABQ9GEB8_9NEOP|nr:hypothetical protein PR048_028885 [Dryococelus australis]